MRVISTAFLLFSGLLCAQTTEGLRLFHQGNYSGARDALRKAASENPDDQHAMTFLALARAATGECAAVAQDLGALWEKNAKGELGKLAGVGHVQCLIALNRTDESVAAASKLRTSFPKDADVLYLAAKVHMRAWNDVVQQMYHQTPNSWRVNQLSAEILETQGKFAEAVAEYRKAIAKNGAAINLHYRLGRSLLMQSHSPETLLDAKKEFQAELVLNPNDAVAEYQLGQIAAAAGDPKEASARFQRALSLKGDFVEALVGLSKLHIASKEPKEAIVLLERAVELQPRNEAVRYNLMIAYRNVGRTEDALKQKTEIDRMQPSGGDFSEFLRRIGEKQNPQ